MNRIGKTYTIREPVGAGARLIILVQSTVACQDVSILPGLPLDDASCVPYSQTMHTFLAFSLPYPYTYH